MVRWLAPRLPGPQQGVLSAGDVGLLGLAAAGPAPVADDGAPVTAESRRRDITQLDGTALAGASLITASALLDLFTADELERFVAACVGAGCPTLVALSVTGEVELTPADPFDEHVAAAFNAHQRRTTDVRRLLGPAAGDAAVEAFAKAGADVTTRPSPWRLGPGDAALVVEWFAGWVGAAVQQEPALAAHAEEYRRRRLADVAAGLLMVTVHHQDLLALPR
jgi:hypothetical protein